ncbi:hypothetical protein [Acidiphilium sp.]|uniref:hypothetical protein n=1 Tax=Acidiphilium sp. TaxID=527 RepID=UPI003D0350AD
MTTEWFTQPRLDLGGASTEDIITRAIDCFENIGGAALGDDNAASMRGHGIEAARDALDHLIADPAFCVIVKAADLDPTSLRGVFDTERFGIVANFLHLIVVVGRTVDLPEAENLVRDTIDAQAAFIADLNREFPGREGS